MQNNNNDNPSNLPVEKEDDDISLSSVSSSASDRVEEDKIPQRPLPPPRLVIDNESLNLHNKLFSMNIDPHEKYKFQSIIEYQRVLVKESQRRQTTASCKKSCMPKMSTNAMIDVPNYSTAPPFHILNLLQMTANKTLQIISKQSECMKRNDKVFVYNTNAVVPKGIMKVFQECLQDTCRSESDLFMCQDTLATLKKPAPGIRALPQDVFYFSLIKALTSLQPLNIVNPQENGLLLDISAASTERFLQKVMDNNDNNTVKQKRNNNNAPKCVTRKRQPVHGGLKSSIVPFHSKAEALSKLIFTLRMSWIVTPLDNIAILLPVQNYALEVVQASQTNIMTNEKISPLCISIDDAGELQQDDSTIQMILQHCPVLIISLPGTISVSTAFSSTTITRLKKIITKYAKNLVIVIDASYDLLHQNGQLSHVNHLGRSLWKEFSNNIITLFSFGPTFGSMYSDLCLLYVPSRNAVDMSIHLATSTKQLNKSLAYKRYMQLVTGARLLRFGERLALETSNIFMDISSAGHTRQVDTYQQILIGILCSYAETSYRNVVNQEFTFPLYYQNLLFMLNERKQMFNAALGCIAAPPSADVIVPGSCGKEVSSLMESAFYFRINFMSLANNYSGGSEFAFHINDCTNPFELSFILASKYHVLIIPGVIYCDLVWTFYINMSTISSQEAAYIGTAIKDVLHQLFLKYKKTLDMEKRKKIKAATF